VTLQAIVTTAAQANRPHREGAGFGAGDRRYAWVHSMRQYNSGSRRGRSAVQVCSGTRGGAYLRCPGFRRGTFLPPRLMSILRTRCLGVLLAVAACTAPEEGAIQGRDVASEGSPGAVVTEGDAPPARVTEVVEVAEVGVIDVDVGAGEAAASGIVESAAAEGEAAADAAQGVQDLPEQPPQEAPAASLESRIDALLIEQRATQMRLDSLSALLRDVPGGRGLEPEPAGARDAGAAVGVRTGQPAEVLDEARSQVRNFGVGVLWSIAVVFLFNYLIHGVAWVLDVLSERSARRRLFFKGMVPIVRIVLWLFAGYLIVRVIFQVDAQGVIAGAAALGVAVGFAAQDLLKNLFGGIILVFDQPFQVGDKIRVGQTYGEVTSIGLRSTRIVTPDDNLVSVPNAQVVDQQVANANAGELNCQVTIDLFLPGDVDEVRAKRIAYEAAVGSKYVYLNKPIIVLIRDELGRTVFTRVRVRAYVLDPRHEALFESDVTERARAGFRAAGMMGPERHPPAEGQVRPSPTDPVPDGASAGPPTFGQALEDCS